MMQKEKLKQLPSNPGVYFHKNSEGEIIYVGKAAVLKNRVRQYFQSTKLMDSKTKLLVSEINDTDWIETDSEIDALFLEAEMVKRYMPKYNILLRDDKSSLYIRIDMKNTWPYISFLHIPLDDGAEYFGPYYSAYSIKKALRYLRKVFPYFIKPHNDINKFDLDTHLGLSPSEITSEEYKKNLRKIIDYIEGKKRKIVVELEKEMQIEAERNNFEKAAKIRNQIFDLKNLQKQILFSDRESIDISKDRALLDLYELFNLTSIPKRIEGYDISHMSGTNVVASMVVFKNGVSDRSSYRKFKIRIDKNDDFLNMNEVLSRRLSEKNIKQWGKPDLILIDGGKGQLDAGIKVRDKTVYKDIPFIGLAKQDEQIVIKDIKLNKNKLKELNATTEVSEKYILINLAKNSHIIKLLQRIRDESHRFAVSYHSVLKQKKQTASFLDEIPGIGQKTKAKLIKKFGSLSAVKKASKEDIVKLIGSKKAAVVIKYLMVI